MMRTRPTARHLVGVGIEVDQDDAAATVITPQRRGDVDAALRHALGTAPVAFDRPADEQRLGLAARSDQRGSRLWTAERDGWLMTTPMLPPSSCSMT